MSNRAPLDEFDQSASSTATQAFDEIRSAETVPQRLTQPDTLPPNVVERIFATESGANSLAETAPSFASRYVVAVTTPQDWTKPIDWTSLPCAGEAFVGARDTLVDDLDVAPQVRPEPFEDEVIGARFQLAEQVHRGVMGWVWRAVDQATKAAVAVKLVPLPLAPALDAQDLDALARVSAHPGLVTIIQHGLHRAWWYQVAIWINGRTLQSVLEDAGGAEQVAANIGPWMRQLAAALQAHHRAGFVHGDVKASNVMVTGRRAYLVDLVGLRIGASWREHAGLTELFASPQARAGAPADPRDDVYGLASMAARILDCRSASGNGRLRDTLTRFQTESLRKALDPDRESRTESVTAFVNAVWPAPARSSKRRFTALGGALSAGTHARSTRRRRWDTKRLAGVAAALATVLLSVGAWEFRVSTGVLPSFAVESGAEPAPAWALAAEQRANDRQPAPQRAASTLGFAGLPSLSRVAGSAAAPEFVSVRNDYVFEPVSALALAPASGPRPVAVNVGPQAPRPEALSAVTDAAVWISASNPQRSDERKATGGSREPLTSDARRARAENIATESRSTETRSSAVESKLSSAAPPSSTEKVAQVDTSAQVDSTVPVASVVSAAPDSPAVPKVKGKSEVSTETVASALPAVADLPEITKGQGKKSELPVAAVVAVLTDAPVVPEISKGHGKKAELPAVAVVATLPDVPEVAAIPKVKGKPEVPAVAVVVALPDVPSVPDVPKVKGKPELPAVAVVAALPDVPSVPDVPKVKGKPEVPAVAVVAALPDIPSVPDVPKVKGKPELPAVAVVAALPDVPSVPVIPKVDGKPNLPAAAVVAALPAVPSVPAIPKVHGKPDLPAAAVVAALPTVPSVPVIPKVHGKPDLPVAAVVSALPALPNLPSIPKIHGKPGG